MSEANVRALTRAETQDLDAALAKMQGALHPGSQNVVIEGRSMTALRFMRDCIATEYGLCDEDLPFEGDLQRYAAYLALEGENATYDGFLAWHQATS
jgi:hypothetical protein